MDILCSCGCGKSFKFSNVKPNRKFAKGHKPEIISHHHPCACGCGNLIASNRKFDRGHTGYLNKGKTKEFGYNLGVKVGHVPWNKGLTNCYTEEMLHLMGNGRRGKTSPNKDKKRSLESIEKQSISRREKNIIPWNKGLTNCYDTETRHQMGKRSRGNFGEDACNWQGGKSFINYTPEFNHSLKRDIRERDNFHCRNCFETKKRLHVHHIDYDKTNNEPENLITLCISCHVKTLGGNREYWINFYREFNKL